MKPERPTAPVVSFRLKPDEVRLLAERADRLGVSPNELARFYVIEAMFAAVHLTELGAALAAVHEQSQGLRQDLSLSVEAMLASAGEVNEKQAKSWVQTNLNRR
jgi:hypothetical protein